MMKSDLAPIGLSTYSRLGHLKQTVEALQKNTLAKASELYIFSDAPKEGDEAKVQAVRDYLKTINGFKKVSIYEREENNRVANNRGGIRMLLEKYDRLIFLEEDVVTSAFFLQFMNDALDVYKDDARVLAITGYAPPIKYPDNYSYNVFLGKKSFFWSFAIWKDDFYKINMNISRCDYWKVRTNPYLWYQYKKAGGNAIFLLRNLVFCTIEALDVRSDYTMYKHDMYIIHPRYSMMNNIGLDGTGEHWTKSTNKFDVLLAEKPLSVNSNVIVDQRILKSIALMYKVPLKLKMAFWSRDLGLHYLIVKLIRFFKK